MAGKILLQAGMDVLMLEKSRYVGGRMATRCFKDGVFDHGAQFLTARDPSFQHWVNSWIAARVARVWFGGLSKAGSFQNREIHPRYIGMKGMMDIPIELAKDLKVQINSRVKSISAKDNLWIAQTWEGKEFSASNMILSAPIPQSLNLLEAGGVNLPKKVQKTLDGIEYHPCITGLVLLEGPSTIRAPGAQKLEKRDIQWLGDNSQKGISPQNPAVTIHAAPEFSRKNFALPVEELAGILIRAATPWLGQGIQDCKIHKWRFSQPVETYPEHFLEVPSLTGLYMIGDAFGGGRIEGAALSGMGAANYLLENI